MSYLYKPSLISLLLTPLSWLLALLVLLRRKCYQLGLFAMTSVEVPVIVVGNISVGGTGKSPLVSYLVRELVAKGLQPGIISRGYGGKADSYPLLVSETTAVTQAGDEAKMLALSCQVPVVVDPDRVAAAQYLLATTDCNVIISDDGLQHYALAREIELAVVDAQRGLGNRLLLPLGPLREPASRLKTVSAIVHNYRFSKVPDVVTDAVVPEFQASLRADCFVSLTDPAQRLTVSEMQRLITETNEPALAVAGIGNPQSYFEYLVAQDFKIEQRAFSDHHDFSETDFAAAENIILMTEKDAIKCRELELENAWYLAVAMHVSPNLTDFCCNTLGLDEAGKPVIEDS